MAEQRSTDSRLTESWANFAAEQMSLAATHVRRAGASDLLERTNAVVATEQALSRALLALRSLQDSVRAGRAPAEDVMRQFEREQERGRVGG